MIIPIILRGVNYLPDNIKKIEYRKDFQKFALYSADITLNPDFEPFVREIAEAIYEIYRLIRQQDDVFLNHDCNEFFIPSTIEVQSLWVGSNKLIHFPGRTSPNVGQ